MDTDNPITLKCHIARLERDLAVSRTQTRWALLAVIAVALSLVAVSAASAQTPLPAPGTVIVIQPTPSLPPGNAQVVIHEPGKAPVVCVTTPVPNTKSTQTVCR